MRPSMLFRLRGLSRSLLLASGIALAGAASAQGTAIKVLVGFPPGGGTDAIARVLADKLKDQLGVPVIVENKAGAGGQLAAQALKAAAPDGNTLFLTHDHSVSILPLVMKNPGFDPAKDFVAVAGFEDVPYYGYFAPAGTPKAVIDRFSEALAKVLTQPDVRNQLTAMGLAVGHMPPEQLASRERAYAQTWARVIKASGFQAQ